VSREPGTGAIPPPELDNPPLVDLEAKLRRDLCEIGRNMWARGMVAANDGNVSARLPDGRVLCTPTGVSKGWLREDQLPIVALDGTTLEAGPSWQPRPAPPSSSSAERSRRCRLLNSSARSKPHSPISRSAPTSCATSTQPSVTADLGITVSAGSSAVIDALGSLPDDAAPAQVLRSAAAAFANANPSTMAALVGGALLAAARAIGDVREVDLPVGLTIGRVAAESISTRGKSQVGDKTILDAIVPFVETLERNFRVGTGIATSWREAAAAATRAAQETSKIAARKGRARIHGDQSIGHPDPGATSFALLMTALGAELASSNQHSEER